MKNKFSVLMPLILFACVAVILFRGLSLHPNEVPSPLVNKSMPSFQLPELFSGQIISNQDLKNEVTLLNVWASWCGYCLAEHGVLMKIAEQPGINLVGWNYKDETSDAKNWLAQHGNPFKAVLADTDGHAALDWGVYGTPETFLIDKHGFIRYKHIGPISWDDWVTILLPMVETLRKEA